MERAGRNTNRQRYRPISMDARIARALRNSPHQNEFKYLFLLPSIANESRKREVIRQHLPSLRILCENVRRFMCVGDDVDPATTRILRKHPVAALLIHARLVQGLIVLHEFMAVQVQKNFRRFLDAALQEMHRLQEFSFSQLFASPALCQAPSPALTPASSMASLFSGHVTPLATSTPQGTPRATSTSQGTPSQILIRTRRRLQNLTPRRTLFPPDDTESDLEALTNVSWSSVRELFKEGINDEERRRRVTMDEDSDSSLNSSISSQDLRYQRDYFDELVEVNESNCLEEDVATGFGTPYFDPSRPKVFFNVGAPRGQPSGRLSHISELPRLDQPFPTGDDFDTMVGQAISSDAFRRPMGHSGQQRDHLENIPQSWPQEGKPTTADILDPDVPLSWPLAGKQKPITAPLFKEPESPALRVRKSGAAASESVGAGPEPSQDPTSAQPQVTTPIPDEPQVTAPIPDEPQVTAPIPDEPQGTAPASGEPQVTAPASGETQVTAPVPDEPHVTAPASGEPQVVTAPASGEPQVTAPAAAQATFDPAVPGCSYQRDTVPDRSNNPFLAAVLGTPDPNHPRFVYQPRPFSRTDGTESDDSSPEEVAQPKPKRVLGTLLSRLQFEVEDYQMRSEYLRTNMKSRIFRLVNPLDEAVQEPHPEPLKLKSRTVPDHELGDGDKEKEEDKEKEDEDEDEWEWEGESVDGEGEGGEEQGSWEVPRPDQTPPSEHLLNDHEWLFKSRLDSMAWQELGQIEHLKETEIPEFPPYFRFRRAPVVSLAVQRFYSDWQTRRHPSERPLPPHPAPTPEALPNIEEVTTATTIVTTTGAVDPAMATGSSRSLNPSGHTAGSNQEVLIDTVIKSGVPIESAPHLYVDTASSVTGPGGLTIAPPQTASGAQTTGEASASAAEASAVPAAAQPDQAAAATEQPDQAAAATEQPDQTAAATEQPDQTAAAAEQPDQTAAAEQPDQAAAATEQPDQAAAATEQPDQTAAATEQPDQTAAATEHPDQTAAATEQPDQTAAATEHPDQAAAATEQPDQTAAATGQPDQAAAEEQPGQEVVPQGEFQFAVPAVPRRVVRPRRARREFDYSESDDEYMPPRRRRRRRRARPRDAEERPADVPPPPPPSPVPEPVPVGDGDGIPPVGDENNGNGIPPVGDEHVEAAVEPEPRIWDPERVKALLKQLMMESGSRSVRFTDCCALGTPRRAAASFFSSLLVLDAEEFVTLRQFGANGEPNELIIIGLDSLFTIEE